MGTSKSNQYTENQKINISKTIQLIYGTDTIPGIKRTKNNDLFSYIDSSGNKITDKKIIERIESLRIPPAWENVWISPNEFSHIQVTGKDEKKRKQYIYHEEWTKMMQQNKFQKIEDFSHILPEIRKEIQAHMDEKTLSREKVLSIILWLLDKTYIRIGNTEYAEENNSFGLTTLRNKHVDIDGNTVTFEFVGKSGKFHSVEITHPKVARIIRKLEELPGYELFQYVDDAGERHQVHSEHVNEYLKQITGEDISAKDFRTWGGTVFAGKSLYELGNFETKKQAKKNISTAVKNVSKNLRNTPAVARNYYIHPTVIQTYQEKKLIPHIESVKQESKGKPSRLSVDEFAIQTLLQKYKLQ